MHTKKISLRNFTKAEFKKLIEQMNTEPISDLLKRITNQKTWEIVVWYLEWLSVKQQEYWIKAISGAISKRSIDFDITIKLRETALKNNVKISILQ